MKRKNFPLVSIHDARHQRIKRRKKNNFIHLEEDNEFKKIMLNLTLLPKDLVFICMTYLKSMWNPYGKGEEVFNYEFLPKKYWATIQNMKALPADCFLVVYKDLKETVCEIWNQQPLSKKTSFFIPSTSLCFQAPDSLWICTDVDMYR